MTRAITIESPAAEARASGCVARVRARRRRGAVPRPLSAARCPLAAFDRRGPPIPSARDDEAEAALRGGLRRCGGP